MSVLVGLPASDLASVAAMDLEAISRQAALCRRLAGQIIDPKVIRSLIDYAEACELRLASVPTDADEDRQ